MCTDLSQIKGFAASVTNQAQRGGKEGNTQHRQDGIKLKLNIFF